MKTHFKSIILALQRTIAKERRIDKILKENYTIRRKEQIKCQLEKLEDERAYRNVLILAGEIEGVTTADSNPLVEKLKIEFETLCDVEKNLNEEEKQKITEANETIEKLKKEIEFERRGYRYIANRKAKEKIDFIIEKHLEEYVYFLYTVYDILDESALFEKPQQFAELLLKADEEKFKDVVIVITEQTHYLNHSKYTEIVPE